MIHTALFRQGCSLFSERAAYRGAAEAIRPFTASTSRCWPVAALSRHGFRTRDRLALLLPKQPESISSLSIPAPGLVTEFR